MTLLRDALALSVLLAFAAVVLWWAEIVVRLT